MISMLSKDYNFDAALLKKANDNVCNIIWHLSFIVNSYNYYKGMIIKQSMIDGAKNITKVAD